MENFHNVQGESNYFIQGIVIWRHVVTFNQELVNTSHRTKIYKNIKKTFSLSLRNIFSSPRYKDMKTFKTGNGTFLTMRKILIYKLKILSKDFLSHVDH